MHLPVESQPWYASTQKPIFFCISRAAGRIAEMYPTSITPQPHMIGLYIVALYILQVGYCALLVFSRTQETKRALIKGCGFPLMLSNWVFALWAICWVSNALYIGGSDLKNSPLLGRFCKLSSSRQYVWECCLYSFYMPT